MHGLRYSDTADEDWVIGFHPKDPSIVIASGGSGHAYKVHLNAFASLLQRSNDAPVFPYHRTIGSRYHSGHSARRPGRKICCRSFIKQDHTRRGQTRCGSRIRRRPTMHTRGSPSVTVKPYLSLANNSTR